MIQAVIKNGRVFPVKVPAPQVSDGSVLIKVVASCISTGTELAGVQESRKSLIRQAIEQPEKIKKALKLVNDNGIVKTYSKIMTKTKSEIPTGYSLAGVAIAVGKGVSNIQTGDRVAAAGASVANHAEYVDVPINLVTNIPDNIGFKEASTVALGGIAMQGIRRAKATLGEFVVVFGTGILGLLSVQILSACGVRTIATDIDERRLKIAQEMGAEFVFNPYNEDVTQGLLHYTGGRGADVVLFCATTDNPMALSSAFSMCRKKGRVVMVGTWGKILDRNEIYAKELDFLISTSYGPGRYDDKYEKRGLDYPYAYVRWTESRNMQEYLRLLSVGKIKVKPLIEASFPIEKVNEAFLALNAPVPPLLSVLDYGDEISKEWNDRSYFSNHVIKRNSKRAVSEKKIRVGLIGAGNFAKEIHLPNLKKLKDNYELHAVCNRTGAKAKLIAQQYKCAYATTDYRNILTDPDVDLVIICTRHNLHGSMVLDSLNAGKHTFVEKPLCTTQEDLDLIKSFYKLTNNVGQDSNKPLLMVGFNRRFSRYAMEVKRHVEERINPLYIHYRMNAGYMPRSHWTQTEEGGGRIIGEACHIIDLFSYLVNCPVKSYASASLRPITESVSSSDNKSIVLEYVDGSVATLEYFSVGANELEKECLEVHFDQKTIMVNNYQSMVGFGLRLRNIKTGTPSKGQMEEMVALANTLTQPGMEWPIRLDDIINTTELTFAIA